jgi:hypothetical protein
MSAFGRVDRWNMHAKMCERVQFFLSGLEVRAHIAELVTPFLA